MEAKSVPIHFTRNENVKHFLFVQSLGGGLTNGTAAVLSQTQFGVGWLDLENSVGMD